MRMYVENVRLRCAYEQYKTRMKAGKEQKAFQEKFLVAMEKATSLFLMPSRRFVTLVLEWSEQQGSRKAGHQLYYKILMQKMSSSTSSTE